MFKYTLIILLITVILKTSILSVNARKNDQTLKLVHIIFRHGNRTTVPGISYPTDPHINETYYPYGPGELTLIGKQKAFELGLQIRKRYNHILNKIYYPPDIRAISSNTSRTQMTLQSVLTAMYPPDPHYIVNEYLVWQPISYQVLPTETDNLLLIRCQPDIMPTKIDAELQELYDYTSRPVKLRFDPNYI